MFKYVLTAGAMITVAACDSTMMETTTSAAGKSLVQMQAEYPDLSVIEFEVLDDNNDGFISAEEESDIGTDPGQLTVDDS